MYQYALLLMTAIGQASGAQLAGYSSASRSYQRRQATLFHVSARTACRHRSNPPVLSSASPVTDYKVEGRGFKHQDRSYRPSSGLNSGYAVEILSLMSDIFAHLSSHDVSSSLLIHKLACTRKFRGVCPLLILPCLNSAGALIKRGDWGIDEELADLSG